ncbi:MAG: hypothetical protein U9N87_06865, partial [Planctomycetota bacterium]|nr:hypothetical protein [Planctomycetota bacterium]
PWRILLTTSVRMAVVATVVWTSLGAAEASEPEVPHDNPISQSTVAQPLRFIRVYSPAEKPEQWPRGQGRYLPVDSHVFERLLKNARVSATNSSVPKANVAQAQYQARLDGDGTLQATARLRVVNQDGEPLLLPLEPCRFAISRPRWTSKASDSGKKEPPAVLGTDNSGRTVLLVERSGEFLFDCTICARKNSNNGVTANVSGTDISGKTKTLDADAAQDADIEFNLELPRCPTNVLLLDLPRYFTPKVDHGIIVPVNETPDNSPPGPSTTGSTATAGLKRWRIDLGGRNRSKLCLARNDMAGGSSPAVRFKQSLVYDFAERGLEVSSDFRLDISSAAINHVELLVDSPLRIIRVQCGDQPVDWLEMSNARGKTGRISLELPQPIHGSGRSVQVWAYGPLVTDRPWRLPRIQAISASSENGSSKARKVFWEQGKATLLVSAPLKLLDIETAKSRISKTGRLPSPGSGELLQLQLFSADARPQVVLSRPKSQPLVDLGIATRLDAGGMTALVTAKLQSKRQEQFQVEAELAAQWIVDSVQSQPPDVLADWRVRNGGAGSRRLAIRLASPLSPKRGVLRLIVGLRHPRSPLGRKLSIDDLIPLSFVNCEKGKSLLAIHAIQPNQLKTWGKASLSLTESASLDADDLELFTQPPQGLVAATNEVDESLRVSLQRQRPSYEAAIRAEARAEGDFLLESYQIRCIPRSSRVQRVLIHFSRVRPSALRWRLDSEENQKIVARRLPAAEEAAAGLDGDGETWEISLRQPRSEPFEISARRTTKIDEETPVSLAALPEASQQKATLVILANNAAGPRFKNYRLEPIPSPPIDPDTYSSLRATYRYNPLRTVSSSEQAELTVLPAVTPKNDNTADDARDNTSESAFPSAWAWSSQLDSCYNPDGTARHSARFLIENAGRDRLNMILPENIEPHNVHGILVNGRPVTWQTTAVEHGGSLRVDLPAQRRFPVVTVHFTTTDSRLGVAESLRPVMPRIDMPILSQHWTAWLPPGYAALVGDHDTISGYAPPVARPSLTQRIFGPLGRPRHDKTFDPFLTEDWKNTASNLFDLTQNDQAVELLLERIGNLS